MGVPVLILGNAGTRFRCSLTAEILAFHNKTIGRRCPLDLPNPCYEKGDDS